MKVAVIGAGIAGLTAAREINPEHEVHLFEKSARAGGHAFTVEVEEGGRQFPVDMGFIVYNERNYPTFTEVLSDLRVETAPSSMGFSVSERSTGIEYSGESLASLLGTPGNVLRADFWRTMRDFVRFCRVGAKALEHGVSGDIEGFCERAGLSEAFRRLFLRPMAGAIWSMPEGRIGEFPASTLLRFFDRHGLLSLTGRPAWRTIEGGSRRYVEALIRELDAELHLGERVEWIERDEAGVRLRAGGSAVRFDEVVLAVHSDQALAILADPTLRERDILGAIRYQSNEAVLHSDRSVLPRRRRAWASWNVAVDGRQEESIAVTYLMNKLQPLPTSTPLCVTLNRTDAIAPERIRERVTFAHPQFDERAIDAQSRWNEISGRHHTHYCGAYWRYGFHEDGARSGRRAARAVNLKRNRAA